VAQHAPSSGPSLRSLRLLLTHGNKKAAIIKAAEILSSSRCDIDCLAQVVELLLKKCSILDISDLLVYGMFKFNDPSIFGYAALNLVGINSPEECELRLERLKELSISGSIIPSAFQSLANSLLAKNEILNASYCLKLALDMRPRDLTVASQLIAILKKLDKHIDALKIIEQCLRLYPNNTKLLFEAGNLYFRLNQVGLAKHSYEELIKHDSHNVYALNNLGVLLKRDGKIEEALKYYKQAIAIKPEFCDAYNNLGVALKDLGKISEAESAYRRAIQLNPDFIDAIYNLGLLEHCRSEYHRARGLFARCIRLNSSKSASWLGLGNALQEMGKTLASIIAYEKAITLQPNMAEAYCNRGVALKQMRRFHDSLKSYQRAISINSNYVDAHNNLSQLLLLVGDYRNGWNEFEWRYSAVGSLREDLSGNKFSPMPILDKTKPLLVLAEQGLGDVIQFSRYVKILIEYGYDAYFVLSEKLLELFRVSGFNCTLYPVSAYNEISARFPQKILLLSLPRFFSVNPSNPLVSSPYLSSDPSLVAKWSEYFSGLGNRVIGVNWQDNRVDRKKSDRGFSLDELSPLHQSVKCSYVFLQRGSAQNDIEKSIFASSVLAKQHTVNCLADSDSATDFIEYASVIASCNAILTTATTVAHLAGSLGVPTFVFVPYIPDWRWGVEGSQTFWYDSVKLYRQEFPGCWKKCISELIEDLKRLGW